MPLFTQGGEDDRNKRSIVRSQNRATLKYISFQFTEVLLVGGQAPVGSSNWHPPPPLTGLESSPDHQSSRAILDETDVMNEMILPDDLWKRKIVGQRSGICSTYPRVDWEWKYWKWKWGLKIRLIRNLGNYFSLDLTPSKTRIPDKVRLFDLKYWHYTTKTIKFRNWPIIITHHDKKLK